MIARWKPYQVERVFLFQATAQFGVHPVPVSRYLAQHRGQAWWVPMDHAKAQVLVPDYQLKLLDAAAVDFGRKYDVSGIGQFLMPKWFQQNEANRFCSEATAGWFDAVGFRQQTFVDPSSFISQPLFLQPVSLA